MIRRNGYGLDEVERRRIGPVVLAVEMRFPRELRNRQVVFDPAYNAARALAPEGGDR